MISVLVELYHGVGRTATISKITRSYAAKKLPYNQFGLKIKKVNTRPARPARKSRPPIVRTS